MTDSSDRDPLRADINTLRRALGIWPKLRQHGPRWLVSRLNKELRTPARIPGKVRRIISIGAGAGAVWLLSWLVRPFVGARDAVCVFYDLDVSPITYDVVWALVGGELLRRRHGLGSVHVVIVPGRHQGLRRESPDYEEKVDTHARRWRLDNIVVPTLRTLPSLAGVTICRNRRQATIWRILFGRRIYPRLYLPAYPSPHRPRDVLMAARRGEAIPLPLRSTVQARRYLEHWIAHRAGGRKIVAITLRDYDFMPARNSDRSAWAEFAARLRGGPFVPVFVPDTETALDLPSEELAGHLVFAEAAWNVGLRMALYECAYLNLMVNTGPHGLCMFNEKCRYIMFKILTESAPQTTSTYMRYLGFTLGETPPFATRFQKWVWEDDSLAVIEREFRAMCRRIEAGEES